MGGGSSSNNLNQEYQSQQSLSNGPSFKNQRQILTINNKMCIRTNSFVLLPSPTDPSQKYISFKFDHYYSIQITLYLCSLEITSNYKSITESIIPCDQDGELVPKTRTYLKRGKAVQFDMIDSYDLSEFEEEAIKKSQNNYYPIIIKMEKLPNKNDPNFRHRALFYYLVFDPIGTTLNYNLRLVRQKMEILNEAFEVQEIFGISDKISSKETQEKDCIICQTYKIDTIIIPCRHMCLCVQCAKYLQECKKQNASKCPICRKEIEQFVRLKKVEDNGQQKIAQGQKVQGQKCSLQHQTSSLSQAYD